MPNADQPRGVTPERRRRLHHPTSAVAIPTLPKRAVLAKPSWGAGHWVQQEQPVRLSALLLAFIKEVGGARRFP
jgi:hypothetical protein